MEAAHERLQCFKSELDRNSTNPNHKAKTGKALREANAGLAGLLAATGLNIPPGERDNIRSVKVRSFSNPNWWLLIVL